MHYKWYNYDYSTAYREFNKDSDITNCNKSKLEQILREHLEDWKVKWDDVLEKYKYDYLKQLVEKASDISFAPLTGFEERIYLEDGLVDDKYLKTPKPPLPDNNKSIKLPSPPSNTPLDISKSDIETFNELADDEYGGQGGGMLELLTSDDNTIKSSKYKQFKYIIRTSADGAHIYTKGFNDIFSLFKYLIKNHWIEEGDSPYNFLYDLIYKNESLKPMTITEALKYLKKNK